MDPGDEVIIPAPYWVSFPEQVKLCDAVPVFVDTTGAGKGFRLHRGLVEPLVTPRTRILLLELSLQSDGRRPDPERVGRAGGPGAGAGDFWILADETYESLVYDGYQHVSIATLSHAMYARTILVYSLSKAYAMTGWRVGGIRPLPRNSSRPWTGLQSQMTLEPHFDRAARRGGSPVTGPQEPTQRMREEFARRRRYIVDRLNAMPGVTCLNPEGAF